MVIFLGGITHLTVAFPSEKVISELPSSGGPSYNRLIFESSPYLRQHATNPVDWHPWSEATLKKAQAQNKPIFLSIGYATCHWCHVMEKESFSNQQVAENLNKNYIAIKVDRQERPDIDTLYMMATQLLARQGGWPNSVWLTPDGKPFFAGTYFPKDRFIAILDRMTEAWKTEESKVLAFSKTIANDIERITSYPDSDGAQKVDPDLIVDLKAELENQFDPENGGFGQHPKFPPHQNLEFLFLTYDLSQDINDLQMILETLDAMADGGIHDHVGGGFHRYATDQRWFVPHFEKMLYDNALLAKAYTKAYKHTKIDRYKEIANGIFDWIFREMTSPEGLFYAGLDADTEHEEGATYLWTQKELQSLLGRSGTQFSNLYGIKAHGNYIDHFSDNTHKNNILHLPTPLDQTKRKPFQSKAKLKKMIEKNKSILLATRMNRKQPFRDENILVSWNGMLIDALAYAGLVFKNDAYIQAAEKATTVILTQNPELTHVFSNTKKKGPTFLEDLAYFGQGLLSLYEATQNQKWLDEASGIGHKTASDFIDSKTGKLYNTSSKLKNPISRVVTLTDSNLHSDVGIATQFLVQLNKLAFSPELPKILAPIFDNVATVINRNGVGSISLATAYIQFQEQDKQLLLLNTSNKGQTFRQNPLSLSIGPLKKKNAREDLFSVDITLQIDPEWHINVGKPKQDYLIATTLKILNSDVFTLEKVDYPQPAKLAFPEIGETLEVYEKKSHIVAWIKVKSGKSTTPINFELG
ncbi:MAG: hypothetical protein ACI9BD_000788, partial [Candidatus Marinamargulisbacteria bacterium]